ncbi:hypothetical protein AB0J55_00915 [Amycolatopsis sp. NPDC049688]|uniref:hypothetical protein n=1 Tax=Amycolatopsis sp. NPDC049688 TaxID=3154733 RepID=UPI0034444310
MVASAADDAGDCATLLAILGLNPADGLAAPDGGPQSRADPASAQPADVQPRISGLSSKCSRLQPWWRAGIA